MAELTNPNHTSNHTFAVAFWGHAVKKAQLFKRMNSHLVWLWKYIFGFITHMERLVGAKPLSELMPPCTCCQTGARGQYLIKIQSKQYIFKKMQLNQYNALRKLVATMPVMQWATVIIKITNIAYVTTRQYFDKDGLCFTYSTRLFFMCN